MNDVPMIVSAGSKYDGTSVVCTPHVSWPSGAATATATEAKSRTAMTSHVPTRRVTEATNLSSGKLPARRGPVNPVIALC